MGVRESEFDLSKKNPEAAIYSTVLRRRKMGAKRFFWI
jgi:hypothetical protein